MGMPQILVTSGEHSRQLHRNDDAGTLTAITLLTELLLALRANEPKGFKTLLEMGLEELGLDVVAELTRDFLVPLLSQEEADRMVGWHWGVSL